MQRLDDAAQMRALAHPTRLRLHDILLWLSTTLRMTHAVALGRATEEWRVHDAAVRLGT